jgi:non-homologous end joining protein Ku
MLFLAEPFLPAAIEPARVRVGVALRKLIAFDDETADKLTQLGRDRMATLQDLADEAFADLLKKHGVPIDLKDALRKSAGVSRKPAKHPATKQSKGRK